MNSSDSHLSDLQLAIMRVLWSEGEATVAMVHDALRGERERALTTIATMLTKMERKGVVTHHTEGRRYIYRPLVSRSDVRQSMLGELTERLFDGSVTGLVAHLLSQHEIDDRELAELRRLIDRAERTDESEEKRR